MKEAIDRDLSKYLESRHMKEGCGLKQKLGVGVGEETWGRKNRIAKWVRETTHAFSKTVAFFTSFLKINFLNKNASKQFILRDFNK